MLAYAEPALRFVNDHGLTASSRCLRGTLASGLVAAGRFDEALETATSVLGSGESTVWQRMEPLIVVGRVGVRRGTRGAASMLDDALPSRVEYGDPMLLASLLAARAEAAWLAGDLDRTASEAREGLCVLPENGAEWFRGELALWLWRSTGERVMSDWLATPYRLMIDGESSLAADLWAERQCPYDEADALAESDDDEEALRRAFTLFDELGCATSCHADGGEAQGARRAQLAEVDAGDHEVEPHGPHAARDGGRGVSARAPHERRDRRSPLHLPEDRRPSRVVGALEARGQHAP